MLAIWTNKSCFCYKNKTKSFFYLHMQIKIGVPVVGVVEGESLFLCIVHEGRALTAPAIGGDQLHRIKLPATVSWSLLYKRERA